MTDEEKQKKLEELCPELMTGLNEGDVNNYMIGLIHEKVVLERRFNYLLKCFLDLAEENEKMKEQLIRITPLLNATKEE